MLMITNTESKKLWGKVDLAHCKELSTAVCVSIKNVTKDIRLQFFGMDAVLKPEDRSSMWLRNVGKHLPGYTLSPARKPQSHHSLPRVPQISRKTWVVYMKADSVILSSSLKSSNHHLTYHEFHGMFLDAEWELHLKFQVITSAVSSGLCSGNDVCVPMLSRILVTRQGINGFRICMNRLIGYSLGGTTISCNTILL
jgi:hypothetical protein